MGFLSRHLLNVPVVRRDSLLKFTYDLCCFLGIPGLEIIPLTRSGPVQDQLESWWSLGCLLTVDDGLDMIATGLATIKDSLCFIRFRRLLVWGCFLWVLLFFLSIVLLILCVHRLVLSSLDMTKGMFYLATVVLLLFDVLAFAHVWVRPVCVELCRVSSPAHISRPISL